MQSPEVMRPTDRPRGLGLQVAALILTALVPVAWLVGRRTVPQAQALPLALDSAEPIVVLQAGGEGLQAGAASVRLAALAVQDGAYRLDFAPGGGDPTAAPPFRLKILGPGGREIWQGSWPGTAGGKVEVVLPARGLAGGPHALVATDSVGRVRSFPFLVP